MWKSIHVLAVWGALMAGCATLGPALAAPLVALDLPAISDDAAVLPGSAVAVSGDTLAVGAPLDDEAGVADCGAVYIFERTVTGWQRQAKLTAPDGVTYAQFGWSVALSGDTLVVGAPLGETDKGNKGGAAYVFYKQNGAWALQGTLVSSGLQNNDRLGWSVALSGDNALVSSYSDGSGKAFIYTRQQGVWSLTTAFEAPGPETDFYGWSVALHGDVAVVGAPGSDAAPQRYAGAAHVYTRRGGVWAPSATLAATDAAGLDLLGTSVAVQGSRIVLGAPGADTAAGADAGAVYVFTLGSTWAQSAKLSAGVAGGRLGSSLALDGETVLAGAPGRVWRDASTPAGAGFLFVNSTTGWLAGSPVTSSGLAGDGVGWSVGVSATSLVVGARTAPASATQYKAYSGEGAGIVRNHIVTNTLNSGPGSLRDAITHANANAGTTIVFRIPSSDAGFAGGVWRIRPLTALPALNAKGTVLDGRSQSLFMGETNANGPEILLDGSLAGPSDGLRITGRCTVRHVAIGGFSGSGVRITGSSAGAVVQSCYLGCHDGVTAFGNGEAGVTIADNVNGASIGGTATGIGNVIAFNGGAGVRVQDQARSIRVRGNAIHSNAGLALNLAGGSEDIYGVTANDAGDGDIGPNALQNHPEIIAAFTSSTLTTVHASLSGAPSAVYSVDLYQNPVALGADPSGHGEAAIYASSATVTLDATGRADFSVTCPSAPDHSFCLSVLDASGNASEFSQSVAAAPDSGSPSLWVDTPLVNSFHTTLPEAVGRAADGVSGMSGVTVQINRSAWATHPTGYWNWRTQVWETAKTSDTSAVTSSSDGWANWRMALPGLGDGLYTLRVKATDRAGNFTERLVRFGIGLSDTLSPDVWIGTPATTGNFGGLTTSRGRAADNVGVASAVGYIWRHPTTTVSGAYWDWTLANWTPTLSPATQRSTTTIDAWANWQLPLPSLPTGLYSIGIIAKDFAGNKTTRKVDWSGGPDLTAPSLFIDEPVLNRQYNAINQTRGRCTDTGTGVIRVQYLLYRSATASNAAGYWDWLTSTWVASAKYLLATTTDSFANWTGPLPALSPGPQYTLRANATDAANNTATASVAFRIVVPALSGNSQASSQTLVLSEKWPALSGARVHESRQAVELVFADSLPASALESGDFQVEMPDGAFHSPKSMKMSARRVVILTLPNGGLRAGEQVRVWWRPGESARNYLGTVWLTVP